jgi:hypothetical protein
MRDIIENAPTAIFTGLGVGLGARALKGLMDSIRNPDPYLSPVEIKDTVAPVSRVPMEVTPEEADELRRKGIKVRTIKRNTKTAMDLTTGIGVGALGLAAGLGGWSVSDKIYDYMRKKDLSEEVKSVRKRIKRLLDDEAMEHDERLHSYMKRAEAEHFGESYTKVAGIMDALGTLFGETYGPAITIPIGVAGAISAAAAYKNARKGNKYLNKAKALKAKLESAPAEAAKLELEPVQVIDESMNAPSQQAASPEKAQLEGLRQDLKDKLVELQGNKTTQGL